MSATAGKMIWQKNPILAWREIDEETMIISPDDSVLHELNETGSFIWKRLDGRLSASDIAMALCAEFDVAPDTALRDTEALLEQLAGRKLLVARNVADPGESR